MKFLTLLLSLALSTLAFALPTQLPLTTADAMIDAYTRSVYVDRNVYASPIGTVHLYDLRGNAIDTYKRTVLMKPASTEKITAAVISDRFRFTLPTKKQSFNIEYSTKDSFGNTLLVARNGGKLTSQGNLPVTSQHMVFSLSEVYTFEADAEFINVQLVGNDGQVEWKTLDKKTIGDKNFFSIPSWWFNWSNFQNGLTTAYGDDENGNFQLREYNNLTGKIAGTYLVDYYPVASVYNHFMVVPNDSSEAVFTLSAWGNYLENPTFELKPSAVSRSIKIFGQTSQGVQPTAIMVTTQDLQGKTEQNVIGMAAGANFSYVSLNAQSGLTYFFRFVWPESITVLDGRG